MGNLYVTGQVGPACEQAVEIFAPGAHGNVAPIAIISGKKTGLNGPNGLAFDAAGNLYVAINNGGGSSPGAINVYAPGATGNVTPIARIAGPKTQFASGQPAWVAVDDAGEIFAGQAVSGNPAGVQVLKFTAGANGNVPPIALNFVPSDYQFSELQVSGQTVYASEGELPRNGTVIYEFTTSDLMQTSALTNPQFTFVWVDVDGGGKTYVQDFIRARGDWDRGRLFEYEAGSRQPYRVRYDGNSSGGGYVVVGP